MINMNSSKLTVADMLHAEEFELVEEINDELSCLISMAEEFDSLDAIQDLTLAQASRLEQLLNDHWLKLEGLGY